MLRIFGRKSSSNVQKVLWCCGELDIPFVREDIGGKYGKNDEPAYLGLNPNGRVPTIDDDGFILWESNAIVRYLCAKHGMGTLCPRELTARADAERWMDWQQTTLAADMRTLSRTLLKTPADDTPSAELDKAKQNVARAWTILDRHLATRSFIMGPNLTMADVVFGNAVYRWHLMPFDRPELPSVRVWSERLSGRPAYRQHVIDASSEAS
jgi:glutathione S-transferase